MATDILATLEAQGLVTKQVTADKKAEFIYRLTEKGLDLLPLLMGLTQWGTKYHPAGGNPALLHELTTDREDPLG